jgi:hypothetical protein
VRSRDARRRVTCRTLGARVGQFCTRAGQQIQGNRFGARRGGKEAFLIAIPLAWSSFHFGNSLHQGGHSKILALILAVVCVLGAAMAAVLAVPRWRRQVTGKLRPKFTTVRDNFTQPASQPSKIAQLFGGLVIAQLVVTLALGARRTPWRAPVAGGPAHRGHRGRRPGLRLPGRGRHGRGRSRA